MERDFEEAFENEKFILQCFQELSASLPQNKVWVVHPVNYTKAMKAVDEILKVLQKEEPEITYKTKYDELLGTDMAFEVESIFFSHYHSRELANIIALADTIDIDATTKGKVRLTFVFHDVRILVGGIKS